MNQLKLHKRITAAFLAAVFCICLCSCNKKDKSPENSIIYYNIAYDPDTLDPQIANDSVSELLIMNLYEGLVRLDAEDNITQGAAEKWDISSDRKVYTFHLRKNLKWSDGTKLTAKDFVYGIQRSVSGKTNSPTAKTLFCIKNAQRINKNEADLNTLGVTADDDTTVTIELEYPDSEILNLLTTPPAMPCNKAFFDRSAGQYGREDDKVLGNGAFMMEKGDWEQNHSVFLRKNKNYTGKDEPVPAGIDCSIGKEIPDVYNSIISGDIDCGAISNDDLDKAKKQDLHLKGFGDTIWGISFNTQDNLLKSESIRHSLLSSVKSGLMPEKMPESCAKVSALIPDTAELNDQSYRKLAGEAAYHPKNNPEQLLAAGLEELELDAIPNITILCTDDKNTQTYVNNLIETWNGFTGAYFNKKPVSDSELNEKIKSGNFQIAIASLKSSGTTPLSTLELFESSSVYNAACLKSAEYDSMIDDIRKNLTAASVPKIKQAEEYILDHALFYPLYTQYRYYAGAKNVDDIIFHPYGGEIDFFYASKTEE